MCMQAYMGVLTSAWSYNAVIQAWEPILEPWKLIVKMDMNTSGIVRPISASSCLLMLCTSHSI